MSEKSLLDSVCSVKDIERQHKVWERLIVYMTVSAMWEVLSILYTMPGEFTYRHHTMPTSPPSLQKKKKKAGTNK